MGKHKYKLTYFNTKGICEGVRYIFAYADVEFEDIRINHEDWPALKEKQPYGKLPVLEIDGKVIHQSVAICRYLGKKFGYVAKDSLQEALLEGLVDNVRDAIAVLMNSFQNKTPETEKNAVDTMKFLLDRLEKLATSGYFYGSKPTWVDMYFAGFVQSLRDHQPECLANYPNLTKLVSNIISKSSVKKYIAKIPAPPPAVQ